MCGFPAIYLWMPLGLNEEVPELGGDNSEDDAKSKDAEVTKEGQEGSSPMPDYGSSPEQHGDQQEANEESVPTVRMEVDQEGGDGDVAMGEEAAVSTPRKRTLEDSINEILSTDRCPVCSSNEHKLIDCEEDETKAVVKTLRAMARQEQKTVPEEKKEPASSSKGGRDKQNGGPQKAEKKTEERRPGPSS